MQRVRLSHGLFVESFCRRVDPFIRCTSGLRQIRLPYSVNALIHLENGIGKNKRHERNLTYLRPEIMADRRRTDDNKGAREVVLLLNIGSPDSPEVKDVARYLNSFLTDRRIITLPFLLRQLLVRGIITPFRKKSSAQKYRTVWDESTRSFPLISHTKAIARALAHTGREVHVAMRYGKPAVADVLKELPQGRSLVVLPLFPHYAMSSYETAVEHCKAEIRRLCPNLSFRIVQPFYAHEAYIRVLADNIRPYLTKPFDKLILSYHGIPRDHLDKTTRQALDLRHPEGCCTEEDPTANVCYRYQTYRTTALIREALGLAEEQVEQVFQSRVGHTEWLRPYLIERLSAWPQEETKRILIACPSFVCDCLESLEEVADHGQSIFKKAGGADFTYIPCLNSGANWIDALRNILEE
ncbi:ferrochelatase [Porphyromonas gingivalis]